MAKIAKKGVYSLSMEEYHGQPCIGPSISSSGLRTIFKESPAHYWVTSSLNPKAKEQPEKEAFTLGRAAHHLLLGEDDFSTLFIVRPDELAGKPWHGNRLDCKAWLAEQQDAGRTVLKYEQIEQIRGMAHALAGHPLVNAGILNGKIEQSLIWQDKETGIWLKARPDAIPNDSGDFADLKGTSKYGSDLDREVSKRRYDMQAAVTKMGAKEVLGIEMASFSFVFASFNEPHCVDVLTLDKEDIAEAERDVRMALRTFAWCVEHNDWFGPGGTQMDARFVRISDYDRKDAEYRRAMLERELNRPQNAPSAIDYMSTL